MERHLPCHRSVAAVDLSDRLKTVLSDRYTIERKIGGGGMADVYLTHDVRHNRKVGSK